MKTVLLPLLSALVLIACGKGEKAADGATAMKPEDRQELYNAAKEAVTAKLGPAYQAQFPDVMPRLNDEDTGNNSVIIVPPSEAGDNKHMVMIEFTVQHEGRSLPASVDVMVDQAFPKSTGEIVDDGALTIDGKPFASE